MVGIKAKSRPESDPVKYPFVVVRNGADPQFFKTLKEAKGFIRVKLRDLADFAKRFVDADESDVQVLLDQLDAIPEGQWYRMGISGVVDRYSNTKFSAAILDRRNEKNRDAGYEARFK